MIYVCTLKLWIRWSLFTWWGGTICTYCLDPVNPVTQFIPCETENISIYLKIISVTMLSPMRGHKKWIKALATRLAVQTDRIKSDLTVCNSFVRILFRFFANFADSSSVSWWFELSKWDIHFLFMIFCDMTHFLSHKGLSQLCVIKRRVLIWLIVYL